MPSILRDICKWCFLQVVPPASAIVQHPDDEKEADAGCWCKALICRQCAAVSLLEGEPSGLLFVVKNFIEFIIIIAFTTFVIIVGALDFSYLPLFALLLILVLG